MVSGKPVGVVCRTVIEIDANGLADTELEPRAAMMKLLAIS
jgi:hypothetical protein